MRLHHFLSVGKDFPGYYALFAAFFYVAVIDMVISLTELSCGGEVDRLHLAMRRTDRGWTSLKEAEVSSGFFSGFSMGLRVPSSVTGGPVMFCG